MRQRPAQDKAIWYLVHLISRCRAEGRERLPTILQLAHDAGVSKVVMGKAVAFHVQHGDIVPRQGKGISIVKGATESRENKSKRSTISTIEKGRIGRWYTVAKEIEKCIVMGLYSINTPLPSYKELTVHFGVSHTTIRKALEYLVSKNSIVYRNRQYYPIVPDPKQWGMFVLFLTNVSSHKKRISSTISPIFRFVQKYCYDIHRGIKIIGYNSQGKSMQYTRYDMPHTDIPTENELYDSMGAIMVSSGLGLLDRPKVIYEIISHNKPIAVLDENGTFQVPKGLRTRYLLGHFVLGYTPKAGYEVGRFLLSQNHRNVVYISTALDTLWSRNRFSGLVTAMKKPYSDTKVQLIVSSKKMNTSKSYSECVTTIAKWCDTKGDDPYSLIGTAVRNNIDIIEAVIRKQALQLHLQPLFEEALKQKCCTAWVCANDDIALEALSYLQEKGIDVPQDISVIGFDDSTDAQMAQLSSYNFNKEGIAKAMMHHILNPKQWAPKAKPDAPVEIPGFVVDRETTRALP